MVSVDSGKIESVVNGYLDQRAELRLLGARVVPGTASHRENYWYVPVVTEAEPEKRFDYYDWLSDVEERLKEVEHISVLIAPSGVRPSEQK
jgi:hypothetical protein